MRLLDFKSGDVDYNNLFPRTHTRKHHRREYVNSYVLTVTKKLDLFGKSLINYF